MLSVTILTRKTWSRTLTYQRNFTSVRTDRPETLPTVAEVLALPVFADGGARVLAGAASLGNAVRWVHVVEAQDVTELLDGHELLLATGVGWPDGDGWIPGYIAELAAARVAGLVLELGTRYQQAPVRLVECCLSQGLPLVVLERRVKFVSVTEAVHGRIIAEQMGALKARDEVHALFSELSLRGSPADYIVAQLGAVLGSPVVLEDMAHQVVAFESPGLPEELLLASWESRSRSAHRARAQDTGEETRTAVLGLEGWLVTPVQARGTRWGYLIALEGAPHPAGRALVLEQAAVALSLSRLADGTGDHWTPASQHWLLASLLQGRYRSEIALRARFEAMGLPVTQRRLCGLALRIDHGLSRRDAGPARGTGNRETAFPSTAEVSRLARSMGLNAVASWSAPADGETLLMALSVPGPGPGRVAPRAAIDAFAAKLQELVRSQSSTHGRAVVAAGAVVEQVGALAASLQEALEVLNATPRLTAVDPEPVLHRAAERSLRGLIGALRTDPRVQSYVERNLGAVLHQDARHGSDLLEVLRAYLAHPGNRTKAAANSHLSRSVFYQRLDTIEGLLGVDLADGEVIAGLQAAVIAWETTRGA
ncbi:PucR family transcriptional regulator [Arthrobacter sp. GMC3]|uniref:PucR family transcriptional regulator n=1 Tax=Arthrobacter sp. GMC3 TaxID=2058894 RepID=UPI0015E2E859|nr:PucR family transcriptional regulator [Arthrobacter sp. GMC3]